MTEKQAKDEWCKERYQIMVNAAYRFFFNYGFKPSVAQRMAEEVCMRSGF